MDIYNDHQEGSNMINNKSASKNNFQPNSDLLKPDGYHLNVKGVSLLAMNIKKTVHHILNIPLPIRRQRSRSRNRIGHITW
jgi:lysophospholipase L1-like esterase